MTIQKVEKLKALEVTQNEVHLTWDRIEQANSYKIYKDGKIYGETTEGCMKIINLRANTIYGFKVVAISKELESKPTSINIRTKK